MGVKGWVLAPRAGKGAVNRRLHQHRHASIDRHPRAPDGARAPCHVQRDRPERLLLALGVDLDLQTVAYTEDGGKRGGGEAV